MSPALSLLGAVPALLAMFYFDRVDHRRPEPRRALRWASVLGGLSTIPIIFLELGVAAAGTDLAGPWWLPAAFKAFVVAALCEELGKYLCLRRMVRRPEFDERLDGIVYATRIGLGFALVENVLYLLQQETPTQFWVTFAMRAVLAIPLHAFCAGFIGYAVARRRFDGRGAGAWAGLFWAVLFHGLYDFGVFVAEPAGQELGEAARYGFLALPLLVVIVGVIAIRRLARAAQASDDQDPRVITAHEGLAWRQPAGAWVRPSGPMPIVAPPPPPGRGF